MRVPPPRAHHKEKTLSRPAMPVIAYLGPEHTNTHLAAVKHFGKRARYIHLPTIEDIFHFVRQRRAKFGVVPVENSLEGSVTFTLDRFIQFKDSPINIHGEIELTIRHYLITSGLTRPKQLESIRGVWSHPQALSQCDQWLRQHLPHAMRHETTSTSEAVAIIIRSGGVAIGTIEVAHQYGLSTIPIPPGPMNKTRFLIIGLGQPPKGKRSKTSVLFGVKDRPGALYDALVPFKFNRINLTKIESRPSKRKAWEYLFFIDLEGHVSQPRVKRALDALKRSASFVRILGSYPVKRS